MMDNKRKTVDPEFINTLATHWRPIGFGSLNPLTNICFTPGDP